jgi:hypothetical protein
MWIVDSIVDSMVSYELLIQLWIQIEQMRWFVLSLRVSGEESMGRAHTDD